MPQPQDDLPFPNAAKFESLSQEILALLATAEHDEAERVLLVSYARDLIDDLGEGLSRIEESAPEWWGWASIPRPPESRFPLK